MNEIPGQCSMRRIGAKHEHLSTLKFKVRIEDKESIKGIENECSKGTSSVLQEKSRE